MLVWPYDRFARSTRALVNALTEFRVRVSRKHPRLRATASMGPIYGPASIGPSAGRPRADAARDPGVFSGRMLRLSR
jgi:hypothetical protein